ncbi:hypothetical protein [Bacillus bombysepticus]
MKKTVCSTLAVFILSLSTIVPVNAESNNVSSEFSGGGFYDSKTNTPPHEFSKTDVSSLGSAPSCS